MPKHPKTQGVSEPELLWRFGFRISGFFGYLGILSSLRSALQCGYASDDALSRRAVSYVIVRPAPSRTREIVSLTDARR